MNKILEDQLKELGLPLAVTHIIPKKIGIKLEEDGTYFIKLSSSALNPSPNSVIVCNFNNGLIPDSEYYKADISKIMSNMIKITGLSCDGNKVSSGRVFNGWLNKDEIEILEKL